MSAILTTKEASEWASDFLNRNISTSNISYLIQYGKVKKYEKDGTTAVLVDDLKKYYGSYHGKREIDWKKKLGEDLNWELSFDHLREKDTTKHVHRLHPYKGKFIPQLVEYFIDDHTDGFKKDVYFKKGDVVLDPFAGSGTTLVQANELGIHSIGIDISQFNCMMTSVKLSNYDLQKLQKYVKKINEDLENYERNNSIDAFDAELLEKLSEYNLKYFPTPDFKYKIQQGEIDQDSYGKKKEKEFLKTYNSLVKKHGVEIKQAGTKTFLDKWYCQNVRKEIDYVFSLIKTIKDTKTKTVLALILSRTIRSCRATTHSDLATLKEPQLTTYYCWKHKKICKPLFSIKYWFNRYANDTLSRLEQFDNLKTSACFAAIPADSREADIVSELAKRNKKLHSVIKRQKIRGIFSSPPYVGQIDYHEQHAYAYDLLGFDRKDDLEIGPLYKGKGQVARDSYVQGISDVLNNCKQFLDDDYDVFLVANDKHGLYPKIAELSGMKIVNEYKRPVLNRTERDRNPYSEIIFHLKEN